MDMEVSMSTLFYLSSAQMDVIRPFFPRSRGIPRRDDQKIISELSMFSSSVSDGRMLQKNTAPIKLFENVRHTPCYTSFLQRIQAKAR